MEQIKQEDKKYDFWPEVIIDLEQCELEFTPDLLKDFMYQLCDTIQMEAVQYHDWYDDGTSDPDNRKMKGTSAVLFIKTSSIVFHGMDNYKSCSINIYSCKKFDGPTAANFAKNYWKGTVCKIVEWDHQISLG